MTETKKGKTSVRTAHSLNPVPFIIYDPDNKYEIKDGHYGLAQRRSDHREDDGP